MQQIKFILVAILSVNLMVISLAIKADENKSLFINLTSNEINRAAMAINFGHRVLQKKKMPTAIFLNVEGVHLVNKNIPQHQHKNGKTIHEMLAAFIQDGGKVIVCPMCMKNVGGMEKSDLLAGVQLGGPDTTWKALFADEVTVLSY